MIVQVIKVLAFAALISCFTGLVACKAQDAQNKGPQPTKDSIIYKGVTDNSCAAEIQYGSYSAGIDSEAYLNTMNHIGKYEVAYTSTSIGREGEVRICFPLTELKSREKKEFIEGLINIARSGQLVSVSIR